jgi:hypothetical protein
VKWLKLKWILSVVMAGGWVLKDAVFWDVTQRGSCKNQHFRGMSVLTRGTWRHIPEDGILHNHRCENLKYYTTGRWFVL